MIGIVIVTVLALLIWEVIRLRREGKKLSAENAKLSEELQKTQDRERSLRSKGSEIFASIGRELIEPLSGVKFTSELIRTRFLSGSVEEDRDYIIDKLDQIYGKTDQMGIFTKTILSTALDDMGEYTVTCSDTDARSLEDMIKKYDHRHVVSVAPIPHVLIHIDPLRMSQVIGNIIDKYNLTRYDTIAQVGASPTDPSNYTQEELELIWAIVAQEDDTGYEGALAVISSAMNRADANYGGYGTTALEQLTADGQYCYSPKVSDPSLYQRRLGGNVDDFVIQAVTDCLTKGVRNNTYLNFRSSNRTGEYVQIGGNWYF